MKVEFLNVTDADKEEYINSLGSADVLKNRTKILVTDDDGNTGYCFMENYKIKKLGASYIKANAKLAYSDFLKQWNVEISENDFYNDELRNPITEIPVKFIGIQQGTGREIYRGIKNQIYYLRENVFPREKFAKWLVCGKSGVNDDGWHPRPNTIFVCGIQTEKVIYDDWNDVAAYSSTYNKNFRP